MKNIFLASAAAIALGAPAATAQTIGMAAIPSGFGVAGNVVALGFSGTYSQQLRGVAPNQTHFDAATSATFGFGNPVSGVGVELGVNLTSFRRFGQSGHLSLGVHHMWQAGQGAFSAALRASYLGAWGDIKTYNPAYSLTGSWIGGVGSRLAMFTVGVGTGWGQLGSDRTTRGAVGFAVGLNEQWSANIGYVGQESVIGAIWNPPALNGASIAFSIRNIEDSGNATFAVDIGRAFALMR